MHRFKSRWLLICILLIQLSVLVFVSERKCGYHTDEVMTYELSNFPNTFFRWTSEWLNTWHTGEYAKDAILPQGEDRFSYSIPYHNQERDVHPPFYYFIIHTFSSMFRNAPIKWIGIIPNIGFSLMSTVILFCLMRKISKDKYLALLTAAIWALSIGALSAAVFIRMYAMLTMLCLLLALLHVCAWQNLQQEKTISVKMFVGLGLCTFAGIMTQYYFLIYCFFLCGLFALYLLFSKRWKVLIQYACVEVSALCIAILTFPKMLKHIFKGYRGREAFENIGHINNFWDKLQAIVVRINQETWNGWGIATLAVGIAIMVICKGIHMYDAKSSSKKELKTVSIGWVLPIVLGLVTLAYIVIVSQIAPYVFTRYYYSIYPLVILFMISFIYNVLGELCADKRCVLAMTAVLCIGTLGAGYCMQSVENLYSSYEERAEILAEYEEQPVIVINVYNDFKSETWLPEYAEKKEFYVCLQEDMAGLTKATKEKDLSNGFLVYLVTEQISEEVFTEMGRYVPLAGYELLTDIGCRVYHCSMR